MLTGDIVKKTVTPVIAPGLLTFHFLIQHLRASIRFKMCSYTTATVTYRLCSRANKHTIEKRYYKKCDKAKKTGNYCEDALPDPTLGIFGSSTRAGPCPYCRDSGMSTGTVTYESVSTTSGLSWGALLTETAFY